MDGAFLIHDCSADRIPSSEDQFIVGGMSKSVNHGELLLIWQRNDFGSGRSAPGRIRSAGGRCCCMLYVVIVPYSWIIINYPSS